MLNPDQGVDTKQRALQLGSETIVYFVLSSLIVTYCCKNILCIFVLFSLLLLSEGWVILLRWKGIVVAFLVSPLCFILPLVPEYY